MSSSVAENKDLHVVFATVPAYGHMRPFRWLAKYFTERGISCSFIGGSEWAHQVENIPGLEFAVLQGKADFRTSGPDALKFGPEFSGPDADLYALTDIFFRTLPDQHKSIQDHITRPDLLKKQCIIVYDPSLTGVLPMLLEAPGTRRIPAVAVGHFPIALMSKDHPPFNSGLPDQGEAINREMNEAAIKRHGDAMKFAEDILAPYHCTKQFPFRYTWDYFYLAADSFLQLSLPELEPRRSDLPSTIQYVGAVNGGNDKKPEPEWFNDFIRNDTTGHPLFLVSSGTVPTHQASDLILPLIDATRDLPVRVIVCGVNISPPEGFVIPAHVRWAQWVAFEDIFPYTACVVTNGGFNGVVQAFASGLPMILAGTTEDKKESTARAAATGAAINLRTHQPSIEQLHEAVEEIVKNPTYKEKALELKEKFSHHDALKAVFENVHKVADEFYTTHSL